LNVVFEQAVVDSAASQSRVLHILTTMRVFYNKQRFRKRSEFRNIPVVHVSVLLQESELV